MLYRFHEHRRGNAMADFYVSIKTVLGNFAPFLPLFVHTLFAFGYFLPPCISTSISLVSAAYATLPHCVNQIAGALSGRL